MEAKKSRIIKSGLEYDHLFPKANVETEVIMKHAGVGDTCAFIPKVVHKTLAHTSPVAQMLKGQTTYDTCRNIWHFVYDHIAYKKDQDGYEQIRSPARAWHDRKRGVDCDCYTTFISSILTNLGIPHKLRITKYHRDYFQHIYPIVPVGNGKYIIVDCVTDKFDYEVPYSEKKDYNMELQYLNGLDFAGDTNGFTIGRIDDGIIELGKLTRKKAAATKSAPKKQQKQQPKQQRQQAKQQKKQVRQQKKVEKKAARKAAPKKKGPKKLLNIVNKVNPATLALRNGVLAAMKLNIGKIGSRLRWSYLTPAEAAKKNIDPERFKKLVATRQKLESLFYNAGGKPENMRKAIITGKGNKDKQVKGLDGTNVSGIGALDYVDLGSALADVLGGDIYYSENIQGMEGLGELGEPVTLATVAAASGVIATIAGMLKKIGDIFKGKGQGSEDFGEQAVAEGEKEAISVTTTASNGSTSMEVITPTASSGGSGNSASTESGGGGISVYTPTPDSAPSETLPAPASSTLPSSPSSESTPPNPESTMLTTTGDGTETGSPENFWTKHKKWLLPVSIGVGGIAVVGIAMSMMKSSPQPAARKSSQALNGLPKRKNHYRKKAKTKVKKSKTTTKKRAVALL